MLNEILLGSIGQLKDELSAKKEKLEILLAFNMPSLNSDDWRVSESAAASIGAFVQSLYTKTEEIFKLIASNLDNTLLTSDGWHSAILKQMMLETSNRSAVISRETAVELNKVKAFRHMFRNSYSDDLVPSLVIENAERCIKAMDMLIADLDRFTSSHNPASHP